MLYCRGEKGPPGDFYVSGRNTTTVQQGMKGAKGNRGPKGEEGPTGRKGSSGTPAFRYNLKKNSLLQN